MGSGAVSTVDLPLLAMRDACLDGTKAEDGAPATPSSTTLFTNVLRGVLLQPDREAQDTAKAEGWDEGNRVSKLMPDWQVFRVLNRLLSADEVLARGMAITNPHAFLTGDASSAGSIRGGSNITGAGLVAVASAAMGGNSSSQADIDRSRGVGATAAALRAHGGEVEVHQLITILKRAPRRVCQYAFRRNDIVWICKDCQADETCVLCNDCFRSSNHAGHEVYFYHAQVSRVSAQERRELDRG